MTTAGENDVLSDGVGFKAGVFKEVNGKLVRNL